MKQVYVYLLLAFTSVAVYAQTPYGYMPTPYGYFHESCVIRLSESDVLHQDERAVEHYDGSWDSTHKCIYPKVANHMLNSNTKKSVIAHSWIEDYGYSAAAPIGKLVANWVVPNSPTTNHGQTIYLFPGVEDAEALDTIAQPVLGWNSDIANEWSISSWNCCIDGSVYVSSFIKVKSGDKLTGSIKMNCASGFVSCTNMDIVTKDVTSGKSVTLSKTSTYGQGFDDIFGGALEVYNVTTCTDYPESKSTVFNDIAVYDNTYTKIVIPEYYWSYSWYSPLSVWCAYSGTNTSSSQIKLYY